MLRRTFCRRTAAATALVAAGCAERDQTREETASVAKEQTAVADNVPDLPVEERSEEMATAIEEASSASVDSAESFEATLSDRGIEVEHLEPESDAVLALEYVAAGGAVGVLDGIGKVAGTYAAYVEGGDPEPELAATLLDGEGAPFGTYHVFADWARDYNQNEQSAAEYGEMVAGTVETEAANAIGPARRPTRSNS